MLSSEENKAINVNFKKTNHEMSDSENENYLKYDNDNKNSVNNVKSSKMTSNINGFFLKKDEISDNFSMPKQISFLENYMQCKNKQIKTDYITNLKLSDINEDSELFILQCPKLLDPTLLLKKKINLNNDIFTHFVSEDLELDVINKQSKLCLLASKNDNNLNIGVKQVHFIAELIMRESMKKKPKSTLESAGNSIDTIEHINSLFDQYKDVKFPVGLKSRHPLFGSNFKTNLKLETLIKEKLKKVEERKQKRLKRKIKCFYKSLTREESLCFDNKFNEAAMFI